MRFEEGLMQQWDMRQNPARSDPVLQRCCKVIWVSNATSSRVVVFMPAYAWHLPGSACSDRTFSSSRFPKIES